MKRYTIFAVVVAAASLAIWVGASRAQDSGDSSQWPVAGHDIANTRSQPGETTINPNNVPLLAPKWVFTAAGDISATPTVFADAVYFPVVYWGSGYRLGTGGHNTKVYAFTLPQSR